MSENDLPYLTCVRKTLEYPTQDPGVVSKVYQRFTQSACLSRSKGVTIRVNLVDSTIEYDFSPACEPLREYGKNLKHFELVCKSLKVQFEWNGFMVNDYQCDLKVGAARMVICWR